MRANNALRKQDGFSLLELLMVVAVIGVLSAIAIPLLQQALLRAHVAAVTTDAKALHNAFKQHYVDLSEYPNSSGAQAFDTASFAPLSSMNYYTGAVQQRLQGSAADGYDSPDDSGTNQEFWLELTLSYDPKVRFLIADSDDAPLGGGAWRDGIFLFNDGALKPLQGVHR